MTYRAAVPPIDDDKAGDPAVTPTPAGAEEARYLPAKWSNNVVTVEKTSTGAYAWHLGRPPINNNKAGDPAVTLMLAGAEEAGYLPAEWSTNVVTVEKTSTGPYATYGIWVDSLPKCLRRTYIVIATLLGTVLLAGPILVAIALLVTPKYRSVYRQYHESGEHIQGRVVEKRQVNNTRGERKWSTFAVIVQFHYPEDNTNSLPFQRQIPCTEAAHLTVEETMELVCLPGRPESALRKSVVEVMLESVSVYRTTVMPLFVGLLLNMHILFLVSDPNTLWIGAIGAIVTIVMLLLVWWKVPSEEEIICYLEKSGEPLPVNGPHEGPGGSGVGTIFLIAPNLAIS